jgi:hypothetical protein
MEVAWGKNNDLDRTLKIRLLMSPSQPEEYQQWPDSHSGNDTAPSEDDNQYTNPCSTIGAEPPSSPQ